jgi:hypothetical protein
MHGHVPARALHNVLSKLEPAAFVLGTEVEAPLYGQYDLAKGSLALAKLTKEQAEGRSSHVHTLGFPPLELTMMELHRVLSVRYPNAPCARWTQWRLDMPLSPCLEGFTGCSMGVRFLQHFVDAHSS